MSMVRWMEPKPDIAIPLANRSTGKPASVNGMAINGASEQANRYLEIAESQQKPWKTAAFFVAIGFVALLLAGIFVYFTGSIGFAILLVGLMIGYMLLMGYWAGKALNNDS
jgi:hypothetical protein